MTDWKSKLAPLAVTGLSTTALVACILGGIALAGECNSFRGNRAQATAPIVAPPTKLEQKAEPKALPCRDVQAIEPGTKARQKLADKYHRQDLAPDPNARAFELGITHTTKSPQPVAEILGERQLQTMPEGGTALVTLEPDGRVELTVVAAPEKLFEWRSTYEAGALYSVGTAGDTRARAWAAVEPLRFARLHLRIEAGADWKSGTTEPYALAGIVWRSR